MLTYIQLFLMPTFPFMTSQYPVIPYAGLYINKAFMHLTVIPYASLYINKACMYLIFVRLVIQLHHAVLAEFTFEFSTNTQITRICLFSAKQT